MKVLKFKQYQIRGFSLIEMMAVLLIMAITAAGVTLHVQGSMRSAEIKEAVQQIAQFDHLTRVQAREQDKPIWLVVDMTNSQLRRTGREDTDTLGRVLTLSKNFKITRLMTPDDDIEGGSSSLRFSRHGFLKSYALLLTGPDQVKQWIVFTGLGGEMIQLNNEDELRKILETSKTGNDAG